jgi:hypothetical protein
MTSWRDFYESIELTEEEIKEALFEGKKKKYFKLKADQREQEYGVHQLRESKSGKQGSDVVRVVQQGSKKDHAGKADGARATDQEAV